MHNYASSVNHGVILFFLLIKLEIMYKIVTLQNDTTIYIINDSLQLKLTSDF